MLFSFVDSFLNCRCQNENCEVKYKPIRYIHSKIDSVVLYCCDPFEFVQLYTGGEDTALHRYSSIQVVKIQLIPYTLRLPNLLS